MERILLVEDDGTIVATLSQFLRAEGFSVQTDVCGRGLKAQMKYADKIGAKYTAVLGDDEIAAGILKVKNMDSGETKELAVSDFADSFMEFMLREETAALGESLGGELDGVDLSAILGDIK